MSMEDSIEDKGRHFYKKDKVVYDVDLRSRGYDLVAWVVTQDAMLYEHKSKRDYLVVLFADENMKRLKLIGHFNKIPDKLFVSRFDDSLEDMIKEYRMRMGMDK